MVFVFLLFLGLFAGCGLIFVRMAGIVSLMRVGVRMLVLVGVDEIAVAMLVGVFVSVLMLVTFRFRFF